MLLRTEPIIFNLTRNVLFEIDHKLEIENIYIRLSLTIFAIGNSGLKLIRRKK